MIKEIINDKDFAQLLENSLKKPVFLIKHSTACGISAAAWRDFSDFAETDDRAEFWKILVRENRSVSSIIAKKTGIVHQSPQVILFRRGTAVWYKSHLQITSAVLKNKLDTGN